MPPFINIVLDGPPGPVAGRFVEVEDDKGASINVGEWVQRPDGTWGLRIPEFNDRVRQVLADVARQECRGWTDCDPAPPLAPGETPRRCPSCEAVLILAGSEEKCAATARQPMDGTTVRPCAAKGGCDGSD